MSIEGLRQCSRLLLLHRLDLFKERDERRRIIPGAIHVLDSQVVSLLPAERRQLYSQVIKMQSGDLFIEMLRQHVDFPLVAFHFLVEIELRHHLVGE